MTKTKTRDKNGRFVKGHKLIPGSEKGWFKKGSSGFTGNHSEETKEKIRKVIDKKRKNKEYLYQKVYFVKCPECGTEREKDRNMFLEIKRGKKTERCFDCSRMTKGDRNSGSFSRGMTPWNKGKFLPGSDIIINSKRWQVLRKEIYKRDDYTCQECGIRNGDNGEKIVLHADHIKPKSLYPELAFNPDNIRTLCKGCHIKTDTYGIKVFNYETI